MAKIQADSGHVYAYARVSTDRQTHASQLADLGEAGFERLFTDTMTGRTMVRPGWEQLRALLLPGDVVVVWRIDRLGRSTAEIASTARELRDAGVRIVSLRDGADSGTPVGMMMIGILASLAEYEADLFRERSLAGMHAARARGVRMGRPPKVRPDQVEAARALLAAGQPVSQVAKTLGIARSTLQGYLGAAVDVAV